MSGREKRYLAEKEGEPIHQPLLLRHRHFSTTVRLVIVITMSLTLSLAFTRSQTFLFVRGLSFSPERSLHHGQSRFLSTLVNAPPSQRFSNENNSIPFPVIGLARPRRSYPPLSAVMCNKFPRRTIHHGLFMSTVDEDEVEEATKSIESTWNVSGLKKEVQRLVLRCHKKTGKASQKVNQAREEIERLTSDDESVTMEELENCPDIKALEMEQKELQDRLRDLNKLEELLQGIKKKGDVVLPEEIASLALNLGVDDKPPPRQPRGPGKKKGPREKTSSRLPYRRYYSYKNIEIRVGKKAEDNDELTLSPKHREGADWWMHASGCPGSHVVIRCQDQQLPEEVVADAAALAARQSKCQGSVIKVSLTRCRDIKKPPGAKAGLVQLTGKVRTVTVNMKAAEERLARLDSTVLIN